MLPYVHAFLQACYYADSDLARQSRKPAPGTYSGRVARSLPASSGPVVLFLTIENGAQFGAAAAAGCLSGALALVGFCVAYAWTARRRGWGSACSGVSPPK